MPRAELLEQIYTIVDQIPEGRITTYGRIAAMTEGATPRSVGAAMRHLPAGHRLKSSRYFSTIALASSSLTTPSFIRRSTKRVRDEGCCLILEYIIGWVPEGSSASLWPRRR
ncbi:MGMT family protein [Vreelandella massiliensis]|uniref:MGMT family protein n=1 Tax=Vreelandella massiliensis TaxID=1816686 RepID=UPI00096A8933